MDQSIIKISVVVTIYNASGSIQELYNRLFATLSSITNNYEIICVEDRSNDDSWAILSKLSKSNDHLKCIRFIRNFGQHAAITAGLHHAKGEFVVLMDGDLQDEPETITRLYQQITAANKSIIFVRRINRKDGIGKRKSSSVFNYFFSVFSGMKSDPSIGTFRIMHRKVVDAFNSFGEVNKYVGGLFYWMNFEHDFFDAEHSERTSGKSNYNLQKMLQLAARGIVSFSNKPLIFSIFLGIICSFFSFLMALYFALRKVFLNISVTGYSSLIVSIFFIGGAILFVLGIIGRYIAEIHDQVRARPEYIIDEQLNDFK